MHYPTESLRPDARASPASASGEAGQIDKAASLLPDALAYARRGWSIVPVRFVKGRKQGAVRWKPYQDTAPDEKTIEKWFAGGKYPGLAVVLGAVSGHLACRDFDDAEAYDLWAEANPDLAAALPTVKTGRGYHVYFRAVVPKTIDLGNGELRGEKSLSVLPPSPHPKGGAYRWIVQLPAGALREIDPYQTGLAEACAVVQNRTEGNRGIQSKQSAEEEGEKSVLKDCSQEINAAIAKTLPTRPGVRNRQVFTLARAMKAIPPVAALPVRRLRPVVEEWHAQARTVCQTQDFAETWADFIIAWPKVKVPLTLDFMRKILDKAKADPMIGTGYGPPEIVLLLSVCRELQAAMGDRPFFLAARTGGALLGVSPMKVCRWLLVLSADGWVEVAEKGSERTMRATRFRFRDLRQSRIS